MPTPQSEMSGHNPGADSGARPPLIELRGITKKFGGYTALDGVDLKIGEAEAVGIIGDNGAGKSTLVKVLSGVHRPSSGTMLFRGQKLTLGSPLDARRNGVEMIYQDLALCEDLDVAQNIFLGRELKKNFGPFRVLDRQAMTEAAANDIADMGLDFDVEREVGQLSGGERQMVAVARALQFDPAALLMDEPTAALSAEKIRKLWEMIGRLKQRGVSILLVSHRFTDILNICDRIVVVRAGRIAGEMMPHELPPAQTMAMMTEMMTGDTVGNGAEA
ncbi:Ribose import ATP-binding protein RbsA [Roseibium album]|uniref:Ribose import ATP-binding protein RbsA n=2 Tax=Roseibium album TaxID=311410 RepID=A0A0M6ZP37_9HYPH|nr:Ribose import ATP-binding protein RbsA [Roseibium album]CTQ69090.1 Ribose import ATP-binding protein RbsA [Roseibium album]CTQ80813.1 Ribose import ATP-binding protein RbsA [Roseibium album]